MAPDHGAGRRGQRHRRRAHLLLGSRRHHGDVTSPWSRAPRCDVAVVPPLRGAMLEGNRVLGGRSGSVYLRYVQGTTFLSVLCQLAVAEPDWPALTYKDQTLTRAEFTDRVERLAALFAGRGVTEGSTVTIGLPNSIGFVESMFAAWALGAVPQPISDRLPALERDAIVDLADPALVVGAPPSGGQTRPVLEAVPGELPAGALMPGVSPEW